MCQDKWLLQALPGLSSSAFWCGATKRRTLIIMTTNITDIECPMLTFLCWACSAHYICVCIHIAPEYLFSIKNCLTRCVILYEVSYVINHMPNIIGYRLYIIYFFFLLHIVVTRYKDVFKFYIWQTMLLATISRRLILFSINYYAPFYPNLPPPRRTRCSCPLPLPSPLV